MTDWGYSGAAHPHRQARPLRELLLVPVRATRRPGTSAGSTHPWIIQMAAMIARGRPRRSRSTWTTRTLEEAKDFAISKAGSVYTIWVDLHDMWDDVRQGNLWATYAWPDAYVALRRGARHVHPARRRACCRGPRAWSSARGPRTTTTRTSSRTRGRAPDRAAPDQLWGYGHANLDVDLAKFDPDVVEVFGLDDLETSLGRTLQLHRPLPARARQVQPRLGRGQGRDGRLSGSDLVATARSTAGTGRSRRAPPPRLGDPLRATVLGRRCSSSSPS